MDEHCSCLDEVRTQAALYALNALEPPQAEAFAQRLKGGCPLCVHEFQQFQRTAALLPLTLDPVDPPPHLKQRLLDRIRAPQPARELLVVRGDESPWQATSVPGVEMRMLYGEMGRGLHSLLVRMQPGTVYPTHFHKQTEQCLVLEGSITAGGITASAGDFTVAPSGSQHDPLVCEEGCLLLIMYA